MNYHYTRQQLGRLFRQSGLTQMEFAQRCGISQSAINRVLSGRRRPQLETLVRVCQAFGVGMQEFVEELQGRAEITKTLL